MREKVEMSLQVKSKSGVGNQIKQKNFSTTWEYFNVTGSWHDLEWYAVKCSDSSKGGMWNKQLTAKVLERIFDALSN